MKLYQLLASLTVVTTAQASFAFYSELGALGEEIRIKGLTNGTGEVESNICVSADTILSVWGEFTQHGLPICIQGFRESGCREEDLTISKDWVYDTGYNWGKQDFVEPVKSAKLVPGSCPKRLALHPLNRS